MIQSSDLKLYEVSVSEFLDILKDAERKRLCIKEYLHEYIYDYKERDLKYILYVKGKMDGQKRESIRAYNLTDEDFTLCIFENIEFVHCDFNQSDMSYSILNNIRFNDCIRECYGEYIFKYGVRYDFEPNTKDTDTNKSILMQKEIYKLYKQHLVFEKNSLPQITLSKKASDILHEPIYMQAIKGLYNFMIPKGISLILLGLSLYIGVTEGLYIGLLFCSITESFFLGTYYLMTNSISGYEFDRKIDHSNDLNNNSKERSKEDQKRQKNKENEVSVN